MAFRATNQLPANGLAQAKRDAVRIRGYAQNRRDQYASTGALADSLLGLFHDLRRARDEFNAIRATPGIAEYARSQEDDLTYDVAAEFNAMVAAIQAVMDEISTTFPTDANGFLLEKKWSGEMYEFNSFTPAQLAPLIALLDDLIASVG